LELILAGIGCASFLLSLALTPLVRRWALSRGFVDQPGERKIHSASVAYGGGIAVALAFALTLAGVWLAERRWDFYPPDADAPEYDSLIVVGAGAVFILILGLIDDKYRLSARTKLLAQLLLAAATVAGGVRITAFIGDNWVMKCVTVLWITLITNSFNLLDNMDGLCAGTVAISSAMLAVVAAASGQWTDATVLTVLCGASAGFFNYNRAPASIFLGDAGSLFCGYLMAVFTVLVTYYRESEPSHLAIGIPLLVLAIPLYDTLSVIVIRMREGRPVMKGDTSHFSHRLTELGMSRRQAVGTIHLACLAIGLSATLLGKVSEASGLLIIAQACMVLTIIALLEYAGGKRAKERRK
jgi:UDP-GlcNAc:undecaprenyl-phosphate GlcNAc-1-phosphate transferase